MNYICIDQMISFYNRQSSILYRLRSLHSDPINLISLMKYDSGLAVVCERIAILSKLRQSDRRPTYDINL